MKLFELTPIPPEKLNAKPSERSTHDISKERGEREQIGQGSYATVFSDPEQPGTVRKISHSFNSDGDGDAYYEFLKEIIKNQRYTKNPFFPKIYDVQVRTRNDQITYYVDMERLHD